MVAFLFTVVDPRGFVVSCTSAQWQDHIEGGHPIMIGRVEEVKAALTSPAMGIYQDANYLQRNVYYSFTKEFRPRYIKVIVEFDSAQRGRVITAFLTDSAKSGEQLIWPTSRNS